MTAYWATALLLFSSQCLSVTPCLSSSYSQYWNNNGTEVLALDFAILFLLIGTSIWLIRGQKLLKRSVLFCGTVFSYLMFYMLSPIVGGAEIILIIPLLISMVYLNRRLLIMFGIVNVTFYLITIIVVLLLRPSLFNLADSILVLAVISAGLLLAHAVLIRSQEMRRAVESLVKSEQKLIAEKAIADKLLKIDALTGLYNHKTFHEYLQILIDHAEKNAVSIHLAILDIDNFKLINDTYGHWVGDIVLKEVAGRITDLMNPNDFAARYGGEEFAVIFTDMSTEEAHANAEAMREGIEELSISHVDRTVTVSVGFYSYYPGDGKELLFRRTDSALYQAKRQGKNRVITYGENEL